MALNVSAWAIRNPLPPIVIMAALIGIGYLAFKQIPITRMPNIDIPVVSVIVTQFGASPGELETQVGKKIEDAVAGVSGVHHIYTTISDGLANTTIEFLLETDTDRALNDIKDAVTGVRADLPRGIDEPQVRRFEVVGLPILTYAAIAPGKTPEQLSWFVEDVVVRKLQGLRGAASFAAAMPISPADARRSEATTRRSGRWPEQEASPIWRRQESRCRAAAMCGSMTSAP